MNSLNPGYYSEIDLRDFGFKSLGTNILVAKNCTIIGVEKIEIGDNVRIDGYSSIIVGGDGWLEIGSYVHIGGYSFLSASNGIRLGHFSNLSQGVRLYTRSDDYSGDHMTNPTVPAIFTAVDSGPISLGRHVIVGSGSIILPNVHVGDGVAVGALSLVKDCLDPWGVFAGCPLKRLKNRSKKLLELEAELRNDTSH